jgi:two-component system response regulator
MLRNQILLVEDNLADIELVNITLRDMQTPVNIVCLRDGEELMTHLQSKPLRDIGLILLDLNMPRMNGFDVLRVIQAHEQWKMLPAVVFSTSSSAKDIRTCYELGARAYLSKPIDICDYNHCLSAIIRFWLCANIVPEM